MAATQISPAEQLQRDITSARSELSRLVIKTKLTSASDSYSSFDSDVAGLPLRIQKVRERKYAFDKLLETQARDFQEQWARQRSQVMNLIIRESASLQSRLRPLESRVTSLNTVTANLGSVKSLRSEISAFDSAVSSSERAIDNSYSSLQSQVNQVKTQLSRIEKTLELSDSACFNLLATESVVRAVKAVWTRDGKEDKDDPRGFLFLTDQRLLFEKREEVATKKVLFITTERKTVQELLFEVPVFSVTKVEASKQGMMKNEDWLALEFESGAFASSAQLHLDGQDSKEWQRLISLVKTRELDDDRAFAIDAEAQEKVKSAPVICPHCGGSLTAPVLRGMETINCPFCGNVIKL